MTAVRAGALKHDTGHKLANTGLAARVAGVLVQRHERGIERKQAATGSRRVRLVVENEGLGLLAGGERLRMIRPAETVAENPLFTIDIPP